MEFTTAPSLAIPKAMKMAGVTPKDVDYYELNQAFSVVGIVNIKVFEIFIKMVDLLLQSF